MRRAACHSAETDVAEPELGPNAGRMSYQHGDVYLVGHRPPRRRIADRGDERRDPNRRAHHADADSADDPALTVHGDRRHRGWLQLISLSDADHGHDRLLALLAGRHR